MNKQAELFKHIPDLSFKVNGDFINLEQDTACGEVERVDVHRLHLSHIAQEVGLITGDEQLENRHQQLVGRLKTLAYEIGELFNLAKMDDHMGVDLMVRIRGVHVLAESMIVDLPETETEQPQ